MQNYQVGLIGAGRFGRLHLKVFSQMSNCTVSGVADVDGENMENVKEKFNIQKGYTDAYQLIDDENIDIIDIASDESTHGPLAIEAIKKGKHVFIEKPIATTYEDAVEIEKLAKSHGVQVMVGNISRFSTPYYSIKRAVENKNLGELAMIRTKRDFSKNWFDNFGKRVHPVYESGIHDIDLILWYANSPCQQVYAVEKNVSGYKYPDLFSAILKFENGLVASMDSAWLYPQGGPQNLVETLELDGTIDADIEVIGEKGTANYKLNHNGYSIMSDKDVKHPELTLWTTEYEGIGGAIRNELEHFLSQVYKNKESSIAPLQDSVEGLRIADAIVKSAQESNPVLL